MEETRYSANNYRNASIFVTNFIEMKAIPNQNYICQKETDYKSLSQSINEVASTEVKVQWKQRTNRQIHIHL